MGLSDIIRGITESQLPEQLKRDAISTVEREKKEILHLFKFTEFYEADVFAHELQPEWLISTYVMFMLRPQFMPYLASKKVESSVFRDLHKRIYATIGGKDTLHYKNSNLKETVETR